jgi:flagellar hook-associated protein 3 FlgL
MRIASLNTFDASVANLQRRQAQLAQSQEQLTSGKRVQRASDDPAAAARAERALAAMARNEANQRALEASRSAMQFGESALGDAGELLQQMRENLVAAGNGSYTDADRAKLASAMRGLRDDLLSVANRSDGGGRYVFGGQGSDGPPLLDAAGGVVYNGATGTLLTSADETVPLALDGQAVFLLVPDPASPGATMSAFDAIDRTITELLTPGRTGAQVAQSVREGLQRLDAVADHLGGWRARAGEALRRSDGIGERLAQGKLDAQRERSSAEDLDMVAAISEFQSRQSGYDAALKTYSIVQRMTLFEYIR